MNREEKAIKIAIFEGVEPIIATNKKDCLDLYQSFGGLMPIVARINSETIDIIVINYDMVEVAMGGEYGTYKYFSYSNPDNIINALQDAIIFYYENLEKNNGSNTNNN